MSVVFFGDFFQLDPCFYGSLTSAVVNYYAGKPVNNKHETEIKHAAKLFATIEKHELTEQNAFTRCAPQQAFRLAKINVMQMSTNQ